MCRLQNQTLRACLDLSCSLLCQAIDYLAHPSNALASELSCLISGCNCIQGHVLCRNHQLAVQVELGKHFLAPAGDLASRSRVYPRVDFAAEPNAPFVFQTGEKAISRLRKVRTIPLTNGIIEQKSSQHYKRQQHR